MKKVRAGAPWSGAAQRSRWREALDALAARYNRADLLHTDPVLFLHRGGDAAEIERLGLLSSGLAFGGVPQIQRSIETVLSRAGLDDPTGIAAALQGFKHRWATGEDVAVLLTGALEVQRLRGGLEEAFLAHDDGGRDYTAALAGLRGELISAGRAATGLVAGSPLLPDPAAGSAAKRWHLMLRWFTRRDEVDLGIWERVDPGRLLIPLDTHIFRISRRLGLTWRRTANLAAAREITARLRELDPVDPVRWDFALTRLGMLGGCGVDDPRCVDCSLEELCHG